MYHVPEAWGKGEGRMRDGVNPHQCVHARRQPCPRPSPRVHTSCRLAGAVRARVQPGPHHHRPHCGVQVPADGRHGAGHQQVGWLHKGGRAVQRKACAGSDRTSTRVGCLQGSAQPLTYLASCAKRPAGEGKTDTCRTAVTEQHMAPCLLTMRTRRQSPRRTSFTAAPRPSTMRPCPSLAQPLGPARRVAAQLDRRAVRAAGDGDAHRLRGQPHGAGQRETRWESSGFCGYNTREHSISTAGRELSLWNLGTPGSGVQLTAGMGPRVWAALQWLLARCHWGAGRGCRHGASQGCRVRPVNRNTF